MFFNKTHKCQITFDFAHAFSEFEPHETLTLIDGIVLGAIHAASQYGPQITVTDEKYYYESIGYYIFHFKATKKQAYKVIAALYDALDILYGSDVAEKMTMSIGD